MTRKQSEILMTLV